MSALVAFNTVLVQFIKELSETFPNDKKIRIYKAIVDAMCQGDATIGVDTFKDTVMKYGSRIKDKDESFFDECEPLFGHVDIGAIWKSGLSEENKSVFWEYLIALASLCEQHCPETVSKAVSLTPTNAKDMLATMSPEDMINAMPPQIGTVMKDMLKGVDMDDVMSLAKDLDESDIKDVLDSFDPSALMGLSQDFSMDKLMDLAKGIDPQSLMRIANKFDKDTLAKVATQVDADGLMNTLNSMNGVNKKPANRRRTVAKKK
jgi:Mg/Co/Ni transporter MgtE